jgi:GAF domain-containing protein
MADGRAAEVWGLVVGQAAVMGDRVSVAQVCDMAVSILDISGAWVTTASENGRNNFMSVTDEVSERIAELQLTLGEGPCCDAVHSPGPVLTSDLTAIEPARDWPVFTPEALRAGAAAIFAFPLRIGALGPTAGVLGLYRAGPGPLSRSAIGDALILADLTTVLLLHSQDQTQRGWLPEEAIWGQSAELARHQAEIDQATGMLTEQLGVDVNDAFARLRSHAYAQDRRLSDVARDIVARRLRLAPDPRGDPGPKLTST